MKLTCSYSGLKYSVEFFGDIRSYSQPHPIFELPLKHLLSRAGDFYAPQTSEREQRLLYLALLHSSRHIEWRTIATPSHSTIVSTFDRLVRVLGWMDLYEYDPVLGRRRGPAFPKYAIGPNTKALDNIGHWLDAWEAARTEYDLGHQREELKHKQARREAALTKLINNSAKTPESYSRLLAEWAADSTDFPTNQFVKFADGERIDLRTYWIRIMREPNFYVIDSEHLRELESWLEDYLDHGSIFAHQVLTLVRNKIHGIKLSLGIDESLTLADFEAIKAKPFEILTDDVGMSARSIEVTNMVIAASTAPIREPNKADYASHVEFLRAKARWILAQTIKGTKE